MPVALGVRTLGPSFRPATWHVTLRESLPYPWSCSLYVPRGDAGPFPMHYKFFGLITIIVTVIFPAVMVTIIITFILLAPDAKAR